MFGDNDPADAENENRSESGEPIAPGSTDVTAPAEADDGFGETTEEDFRRGVAGSAVLAERASIARANGDMSAAVALDRAHAEQVEAEQE